MAYEIEVIELTPQPALVVETECAPGEFGDVLAASFGRVFQHMGARSAQPHGMPFMRYLDMGDDWFRIQAGIPSDLHGEGDIQAIELPGGKSATTLFLGPYDEVGDAWDELRAWAVKRGLDTMGGWDVYENDPTSVSDPAELRTRLYLPAE